jgi:serine/threonine protein kinase
LKSLIKKPKYYSTFIKSNRINVFSALHHPNVIRYLGLHVSKAGDTFMVMEFAQKGSLKDFLKNEKSTLKMTNRYEL